MKKWHKFISVLSLTILLAACGSEDKPLDTDGDGVPDASDVFPQDRSEQKDTDEDGVGDNADAFPENPDETLDTDDDGIGNNTDEDDDGDDVDDADDAFPLDSTETEDVDADGIGDNTDLDLNSTEQNSINLTRLIEKRQVTRFLGPQEDIASQTTPLIINAGDVNNDGHTDTLISYKWYLKDDFRVGIVYLFFGSDQAWPQEIDLNNIPESVSHIRFEKVATATAHTELGYDVKALGDVNADGIDDFAISEPKASIGGLDNVGMAHIVYGRPTWVSDAGEDRIISHQELKDNYTLTFHGEKEDSYFGWSVANVGDVNGDKLNDIAISQPLYPMSTETPTWDGRIFIVLGGDNFKKPTTQAEKSVSILDIKTEDRILISNKDNPRARFGHTIVGLGNFDNDPDGLDDFLVHNLAHKSWMIILSSKNRPANNDLADILGPHGFTVNSEDVMTVTVGNFLADELEANSKTADIAFMPNTRGQMFILKGGVGNWPAEISYDTLSEALGVKAKNDPNEEMGYSMATLPDTDNDGLDELIMASSNAMFDASIQIISAPHDWSNDDFTALTVNQNIKTITDENSELDWSTTVVIGDLNKDGFAEMVISDLSATTINGHFSGQFFVVNGFDEVYEE